MIRKSISILGLSLITWLSILSISGQSNQQSIGIISVDSAQYWQDKYNGEKRYRKFSYLTEGALLLVLFGILYFAFKQRMKYNAEAASKKVLLTKEKVHRLKQENKILRMSSLIEGQEEERNRLAKDLHDGLGSLLTSIKAHYGKLQSEFADIKKLNVFGKAQAMMDEAVDEVRRISQNMLPPMLRVNGLAAAGTSFLENVAGSHNIKLVLDIRNMEERIDKNKALFLYRIIQELTNNVVKHAEATEIQLQMIRFDDQIQIIFEDNGKGFDYRPDESSGVGLHSIRSRMDYLSGEIDFTSNSGQGTVVEMMIPI